MRYVRSPAVFFEESIFSPPLLPRMLTNPRTVWACQPVVSMTSASVTPFARFIIAITSAFLLVRSLAFGADFARAGDFLPFAAFAALFLLADFLAVGFVGATCALCSGVVAALSMICSVFIFESSFSARALRLTIHHFHEKAKSSQDALADFPHFLSIRSISSLCFVFPSEPPVVNGMDQNGAEPARARGSRGGANPCRRAPF